MYQFKVRAEAWGGAYIESDILTIKVGCLPQNNIRFSDSSQFVSLITAYIESPIGETVYEIADYTLSDEQGQVDDLQSIISCQIKKYEIHEVEPVLYRYPGMQENQID